MEVAGAAMLVISACVMRGINNPDEVDDISNIAEELGGVPVVLIATFWLASKPGKKENINNAIAEIFLLRSLAIL